MDELSRSKWGTGTFVMQCGRGDIFKNILSMVLLIVTELLFSIEMLLRFFAA